MVTPACLGNEPSGYAGSNAKQMKARYYISILLLFCTSLVFGQAPHFTASADRTTVGTGEQFQVTYSVNANGDGFTPPGFGNFQMLSGPNMSTSMESINGSTTVSTSYSFILMPVKQGTYTLAPASIVVNGRRLTSNTLTIKVIKGHTVPQNNQAQNGPDNSVHAANPTDLSKALFIRAIVDKNSVYLGQQLTVDYKLYTDIGIEDSQADAMPVLDGFWSEDIKPLQQQVQWHVENYNGRRYNVADLKQTILFPQRTGNLVIDPMKMTFVVKVPQSTGDDIMDQFFGSYKEGKYQAKSAPVTIRVKPLPEAGKPESFSGAVGHFSIESSVDKTELKANDALNYKVKITGSGNIKLLNNLNTNFPPEFEKYDPKITDTVTESANGVSGSRFYDYLLIPRNQGTYTIPPFQFSYFNPETGKYASLSTKPFQIKVDKGAAENNVTAFSGSSQEDVRTLGKDIRYIKTEDNDIFRRGDEFFGSLWYFILLLVGPAACYAAFAYRNWLRKANSDIVTLKSRRAGKVAARHLASAQAKLQANDSKAFYECVFRGLYGYLSDKLNIEYANLDKETIASALHAKKAKEQTISRLLDTLDLCEMARYAPVTHISEKEVYERAKGIINDIEDEI